jgi:hypothetical protein
MTPHLFSGVEHAFHLVFTYGAYAILVAIVIRLLLPYWKGGRA